MKGKGKEEGKGLPAPPPFLHPHRQFEWMGEKGRKGWLGPGEGRFRDGREGWEGVAGVSGSLAIFGNGWREGWHAGYKARRIEEGWEADGWRWCIICKEKNIYKKNKKGVGVHLP